MSKKHEPELQPIRQDALIELALELNRLASGVLKEVRKASALKGLSNLTAMRPLQEMLIDQLSNHLHKQPQPDDETTVIPGYL